MLSASRAGANRGTACQHFARRENLIQATVEWVSGKLFRTGGGDPATAGKRGVEEADVAGVIERLADFAIEKLARRGSMPKCFRC